LKNGLFSELEILLVVDGICSVRRTLCAGDLRLNLQITSSAVCGEQPLLIYCGCFPLIFSTNGLIILMYITKKLSKFVPVIINDDELSSVHPQQDAAKRRPHLGPTLGQLAHLLVKDIPPLGPIRPAGRSRHSSHFQNNQIEKSRSACDLHPLIAGSLLPLQNRVQLGTFRLSYEQMTELNIEFKLSLKKLTDFVEFMKISLEDIQNQTKMGLV